MAETRKKTEECSFIIVGTSCNDKGDFNSSIETFCEWNDCLKRLKELITDTSMAQVLAIQGRILPIKDDFSKIKLGETEFELKDDKSVYVDGFVDIKGGENV